MNKTIKSMMLGSLAATVLAGVAVILFLTIVVIIIKEVKKTN